MLNINVNCSHVQAFLLVLEYGTSLGLNFSNGWMIAYMLGRARAISSNQKQPVRIPLPLPNILYYSRHIIIFYYSFACFYDLAVILRMIILKSLNLT
jgi:hypothetical protein